MKVSQRQHDHFNKISHKYIEAREDSRHRYLKEKIWSKAFNSIPDISQKNFKVLDIMCGKGELYYLVNKYLHSFSYEGLDISEEMIAAGKKENPDINLKVCDILSYQTNNKYDIIIISGGLHHIFAQAETVLKKVASWLVPGGYFVNLEPVHNNLLTKTIRNRIYSSNDLFDEQTEQGFSSAQLNQIGARAGLQLQTSYFPGLLSYVLWYNPDCFPMLNKGPFLLTKIMTDFESRFWSGTMARYFTFAQLAIWKSVS